MLGDQRSRLSEPKLVLILHTAITIVVVLLRIMFALASKCGREIAVLIFCFIFFKSVSGSDRGDEGRGRDRALLDGAPQQGCRGFHPTGERQPLACHRGKKKRLGGDRGGERLGGRQFEQNARWRMNKS